MKITRNALALAAIAGLAAPALAQDSISNLGTGLPGDAPNAFDSQDQVDKYVVDLVPFTTSWGTEFGLGVLHKSPNVDGPGGFFGSLISAQAISQNTITTNVNDSFDFWQQAGAGVSANNSQPGSVDLNGEAIQQATVFAGFGGASNTINTSLINIDPADSSRLYVTRVLAGNNQSAAGGPDTAQFGVGSIDAAGNAYFRADAFGSTGTPLVNADAYGRIRTADRTQGQFNQITGPGLVGQEATDDLANGGADFLTPHNIPAEIFGGNGSILTGSFGTNLITAFGNQSIPNNGTRGAWSVSPNAFTGFANPGAVTATILDKEPGGETNSIRVVGVDAAGQFTGSTRLYTRSNNITDNSNGFVLNAADSASVNHFSQTRFRGGNGQTDVNVVPGGDLISAATLAVNQASRFDQDPDNFIVAFRETPGGAISETLVAYTTFGASKEILDGPGGNTIGTLLPIDLAFTGTTGPTMSAPSIDSAGNIWFASPFQLSNEMFADVGLFRAVYNPANFSYELELVVRTGFGTGTTLTGLNSNTPFQLTFGPSLADGNSVSSGTLWSSNVSNDAALDQNPADFEPADPNTLGGAVLSVELAYDIDNDGTFDDPTSSQGNPASIDESYNALVYIGALTSVGPQQCSPADINADGSITPGDVNAFIIAFQNGDPIADVNGDGAVTPGDVNDFINLFQQGCP